MSKRKQLSISSDAELGHHDRRQCNSTAWNGRLRSGRPSGGAAAAAAVDAQLLQPAPVPPLPQLTGLDRGMPPLHYAVQHNDLALVRRLVDGGADVNQADPASGMQPLHRAVAANFFLDMTELLLSLGADVDGRDARGRTPLMTAASVISERLVPRLLRAGGDVAARDATGQTALHHAAADAHYASTIDALVQGGADMAAKDATGLTPLHLAAACRKWHNATALVAAGASLEAQDNLGRTPLDHVDNPDWKRLLLAGRPAADGAKGQPKYGAKKKAVRAAAAAPGAVKQRAKQLRLEQAQREPEGDHQPDRQQQQQQQQQQAVVAVPANPAPAPAPPPNAPPAPAPAAGPAAVVAVAAVAGPDAAAPASLQAQLQQLRALLAHCRAGGQLDLDAAADYRLAFAHALTPEQRQEDLELFGELAAAGKLAKLGDCVRRVAAMQQAGEAAVQQA